MFAWRRHDPKVTAAVLARLIRRLRSTEPARRDPDATAESRRPPAPGRAAPLRPFRRS